MRIALFTPGITPYVMGGLQRHSFNLARHLVLAGVDLDLYHTDFAEGKGIDDLEGMSDQEKSRITSIGIPWPKGDRMPGHYVRELKRFSSEAYTRYRERPPVDFIIAKSLTAWSMVEAKRGGTKLPPIGVNLHGYEMFQKPANIKSAMHAVLMRPPFRHHASRADYLFSYGGRITDLIRDKLHIPTERILEIPGGIDSTWIADTPSAICKPLRFVFLGRYERRKGIEELHAAIASSPAWQNDAQFHFIGPIPEEKRLNLPHVSYAGAIQDTEILQRELHGGDFLVCPSHSEGMPNSILEGMAAGLAVIGTDVGAVRLLVSGDNGVLLPQVSTEALVSSISRFTRLPETEIMAMKMRSIERVRAFTWDQIARQTISAVRNCL